MLAIGFVSLACGSDETPTGKSTGDDRAAMTAVGTTPESSPFVVENPPAGYQLVLAGRGDLTQTWSSDSVGDDEPVTVLAPPGADITDPAGPGVVTVSLTGYAGFQGGLDQAAVGYPAAQTEEFDIDGHRALYTSPDSSRVESHGADLVVAVGEDLAVRVGSATGSREQLADIARRVRPRANHLLAPEVPNPPQGLRVAGWADADVAVTLQAGVLPSTNMVPAGARAHAAVWAHLDPSGAWTTTSPTIVVSTPPGNSATLDALPAAVRALRYPAPTMSEMALADRPALLLELAEDEEVRRRALITSTADGDTLLVTASGGELPDTETLVEVATSVRRTTPEAWDAFVVEARGGPGLHADPGAVELERGVAEGVEWLFQARIDDGSLPFLGGGDVDPDTGQSRTAGEFVIDPCLKLADGKRACLGPGGSEQGFPESISATRVRGPLDDGGQFPGFHMVMTTQPAVTLRITRADGISESQFHELPGGVRRGAVIVTDVVGPRDCDAGLAPSSVTVSLVDAGGRPLPCY